MRTPPPARTRRLFAHYEGVNIPGADGLVLARLLEEGDSFDLRWLTGALSENALSTWLQVHGDRQLSRRSLAFWSVLLNPPGAAPNERENGLWPL